MDVHQFDTVTTRLSTRFSRRTALRGASAGLAAVALGALASSVEAQDATPGASGAKVSAPIPGNQIHPNAGIKSEFLFTASASASVAHVPPSASAILISTPTYTRRIGS